MTEIETEMNRMHKRETLMIRSNLTKPAAAATFHFFNFTGDHRHARRPDEH
jgi:hypothetical protein